MVLDYAAHYARWEIANSLVNNITSSSLLCVFLCARRRSRENIEKTQMEMCRIQFYRILDIDHVSDGVRLLRKRF